MTDRGSAYEVRVQGHLDDHWSGWLGDFDLTRNDDGTTTLAGEVADQAQLYGVLTALRDLGIPLVSVSPAARRPTPTKE